MKYLFALTFCLFAFGAFAQQAQNQYILIIRSKVPVKASQEAITTNIQHWTAWMTDLGKNGKIAGGYRPVNDGVTLKSADKPAIESSYVANGELVSSFLIINAADMAEAKLIAAKCPVFELDGNVEIRLLRNTAN
ncbi:YciI family protein [Mucilaginibacter sp.]